jgi:hypothetical protein
MASPDLYIVKLPTTAGPGSIKISIANVGLQILRSPVTVTFDLSR